MSRWARRSDLAHASMRFGAAAVALMAVGLFAVWEQADDSPQKLLNPAWCLVAAPLVAVFGLIFGLVAVSRSSSGPRIAIALALNLAVLGLFSSLFLFVLY